MGCEGSVNVRETNEEKVPDDRRDPEDSVSGMGWEDKN